LLLGFNCDGEDCGEEDDDAEEKISQAMKEVFVEVDRGLLDEAEIEPMYAGTTACAVLLRKNKLYISNCGDSRAILASTCRSKSSSDSRDSKKNNHDTGGETDSTHNNSTPNLTITPLSIDQNPNSPGEQDRILSSGGYVSQPPEPDLSSRVWLDPSHTQIGLAMARSIGDHAVKDVGVIATPVVAGS